MSKRVAWTAKKISFLAGAAALFAEIGLNNGLVMGLVYTGASAVTAPVIVRGVELAHDASEARLAADRLEHAKDQRMGSRSGRAQHEAGDADQIARQSDEYAEDSPDMPRRLGPMLVARRAFLGGIGADPARAASVLPVLDKMLADDRRAFLSFEKRAEREPVWAAVHAKDLAELHAMDAQLASLRRELAPDD